LLAKLSLTRQSQSMSTRLSLVPHPQSLRPIAQSITVDVAVRERALHLAFQIRARAGGLAIPDYEEPVRADGLWQETCCEAFVRAKGQAGYYEVNLSPSTQWAVYRFSAYREAMRPVDIGAAPVIDRDVGADRVNLMARIDLSMLPAEYAAADWQIGLSCVVRDVAGATAYWALNHPPEKPDFHHDDCFAHQIGAAERT
jgi:hypothetical protein